MIADIFYPIFTQMISNLACFIQRKKQNCLGASHPCLHQGIALDSLRGFQLPPDAQLQLFLAFWPKTDEPELILYYPLT